MKIKILSTNEIVEGEGIELNYVKVGNKFYSPDEYRLIYTCDSCSFQTCDGIESVAHEKQNLGHYCDLD